MDPAFTWQGDIEQTISRKEKAKTKTFKHRDQIAAEIVYFSDCILKNKKPEPSGREGFLDVRIIDALRTSYSEHRTVTIEPLQKKRRPRLSQSIKRKPAKKPKLVNAAPPSVNRRSPDISAACMQARRLDGESGSFGETFRYGLHTAVGEVQLQPARS
jgi:glucose-fructose oxidoreductase